MKKHSPLALAAAVLMAIAIVPSSASAQRDYTESDRQRQRARGEAPPKPIQMEEAAGIVSRANLACTVTDTKFLGQGKVDDGSGTQVDSTIYEVVCSEGLGWIVAGADTGTPTVYDCMAAATASAAAEAEGKEFGAVCTLPANLEFTKVGQSLAQRAGLTCTVDEAAWVGRTSANAERYEIGCAGAGGWILDVAPGADGAVTTTSCLKAAVGGQPCRFTSAEERLAGMVALAAAAERPCQVTDGRFVATDPAKNTDYIELACTEGPGFMVEVSAAGAPQRTVDCVRASGIAGGCTLTDVSVIRAAEEQSFKDRLSQAGFNCSYEQHRVVGEENHPTGKRIVIEYKCADRPMGLMAFLPQPGSAAAPMEVDCITGAGRGVPCVLTTKEAIMARLTAAMTTAGRPCAVSDYRVLGAAQDDGDVLELACTGGATGYIIELPGSRATAERALTCAQSAQRGGDTCELS